jgi:hypothetical protein
MPAPTRTPSKHRIGGWLFPRSGLEAVEKRKSLTISDLNCDHSVVQSIASSYTDYATSAPVYNRRLIINCLNFLYQYISADGSTV